MRILLIDDHCMIRIGMKSLILQVYQAAEIREAAAAEEALQIIETETLDLVFLDLKLSQETESATSEKYGLNILQAICAMKKSVPVIAMSGEYTRQSTIELVLRAGAASFISTTSPPEVILEAIQHILAGGVWLPPETTTSTRDIPSPSIASLLQHSSAPAPITATNLNVTEREFDVLRLAMQGNAPWKVAKILGINPSNTRRYLSKLYNQFGVIDLYSLQCHFAKSGQLLGIISSPPREYTGYKESIRHKQP